MTLERYRNVARFFLLNGVAIGLVLGTTVTLMVTYSSLSTYKIVGVMLAAFLIAIFIVIGASWIPKQ